MDELEDIEFKEEKYNLEDEIRKSLNKSNKEDIERLMNTILDCGLTLSTANEKTGSLTEKIITLNKTILNLRQADVNSYTYSVLLKIRRVILCYERNTIIYMVGHIHELMIWLVYEGKKYYSDEYWFDRIAMELN